MVGRCHNPKHKDYQRYGASGIKVCDRWRGRDGYAHFFADMGRRPSRHYSLDRINNQKGYSPDNCRWATRSQQRRNQERYKQLHPSEDTIRRLLRHNGPEILW